MEHGVLLQGRAADDRRYHRTGQRRLVFGILLLALSVRVLLMCAQGNIGLRQNRSFYGAMSVFFVVHLSGERTIFGRSGKRTGFFVRAGLQQIVGTTGVGGCFYTGNVLTVYWV